MIAQFCPLDNEANPTGRNRKAKYIFLNSSAAQNLSIYDFEGENYFYYNYFEVHKKNVNHWTLNGIREFTTPDMGVEE